MILRIFSIALAVVFFLPTGTLAGRLVNSGAYVGDSVTGRAITGLGFQPDLVLIKGDCPDPAAARSSSMPPDAAKELGTNHSLLSNVIISLDADGFTIGSNQQVNSDGVQYYWVAFKAGSEWMRVGSYVGDDQDDRKLTLAGFAPTYVIVMSEEGEQAMQRFSSQLPDRSLQFDNAGEKGDRIQSFESNGLIIGKHNTVNENGKVLHYVAWKSFNGRVFDAGYVGDGADNRDILGAGFQPECVLVKSETSESPVFRPASLLGDLSLEIDAGGVLVNGIQALLSDGFQVGTLKPVNESGKTLFWVAFGAGESADLAVIKSVDRALVGLGDTLTYEVLLTNNGPDQATSITVLDTVPSGLTYVSHSQTKGTYSDATGIWSINSLNAASTAVLSLTVVVNEDAGGSTITNRAAIMATDQVDTCSANDADSVIVQVTSRPIISPLGPYSVAEGDVLSFPVAASDADGDSLTLTAEDLPANAAFVDSGNGTGGFTFAPDYTQSGTYDVRFIASDGLFADTAVAQITVIEVNRPPVLATVGPFTITEGQRLSFSISADDPDGTIPQLLAENLPAGATFTDSGNGTGAFDFTPDFTQAGVYVVRFVASDGQLADTLSVSINVTNVNRPPVLAPVANKIVAPGQKLSFLVTATDPDSTIPALSAYGVPPNATFVDRHDGKGEFTFQPTLLQLGPHLVRFVASDAALADTIAVTITVIATNLPPLLVPIGAQSTVEGQVLVFPVAAIDPESTIPSLAAADVPPNAVFVDHGSGAGSFEFRPDYTQAGKYNVWFIASDGSLADSELVPITVAEAGNQRPQLTVTGPGAVIVGQQLQSHLAANDPDGTVPVIEASGMPVNAVFTDSGNGSAGFDFSPSYAQVGSHTVTFIASDEVLADSEVVSITVNPAQPEGIEVTPDWAVVSADSTIQFTATAYDSLGNPTDPGVLTWSLTAPLGTIDANGVFHPVLVGQARAVAVSSLGPADSSAHLEVTPGRLTRLTVSPDTAQIAVGEQAAFSAVGVDGEGNVATTGTLTWKVNGNIGTITSAGVFTATAIGSGRIIATSSIDGIVDTTGTIAVVASGLTHLLVTPDTLSLRVGEGAAFSALGFNAVYEPADLGTLSWEVLGGIGTIDQDGAFTATQRGAGRIVATSDINAVSDTSNFIVVDILTVSALPLGDRFVHAGETGIPVLALKLENRFGEAKAISGITVRDASQGAGTAAEVLGNIASLSLYVDADGNQRFSAADQLLTSAAPASATAFSFAPVTIGPLMTRAFFVTHAVGEHPRDGDSLDFFLLPQSDFVTPDDAPIGGESTVNSLGASIVDGLVAAQLGLRATGTVTLQPANGLTPVFMIDLPRNGYRADTLEVLTIRNEGSARPSDFDSLVFFADNGNGTWDSPEEEYPLGNLRFTGGLWSISGLTAPLAGQSTRFYVAAKASLYAGEGAGVAFGVPIHAIEMSSDNDGPIDQPLSAVESIPIVVSQAVTVTALPVAARALVPGTHSGPLLGMRIVNGQGNDVALQSLVCSLEFTDPEGATADHLVSQIDSVFLWLDGDDDIRTRTDRDSLVSAGALAGDQIAFPVNGLPIAADGGVRHLVVSALPDLLDCKNANLLNLRIGTAGDFIFAGATSLAGDFPLENDSAFPFDIFPAASVTVHELGGLTIFGGDQRRVVLDFELPRNGYAADTLTAVTLQNRGTVDDGQALGNITLWADAQGDGFTTGDVLVGRFAKLPADWRLTGVSRPLTSQQNRFFVTVDVASDLFDGGTLDLQIPVGGVRYASETDGPDDYPIRDALADLVFLPDRITVISLPAPGAMVHPGTADHLFSTFALYNGYQSQTKTLASVRWANDSWPAGTALLADAQLGQVSLYRDADGNRQLDSDPIIATGYFVDRRLRLTGLNVALAPEELSYFFVTADIPLEVIDADTLVIAIREPSDFEFTSVVSVNGDVPLSGAAVVDGSVTSQYRLREVSQTTLSAGDTDALVFAFVPAKNGGLPDTLTHLELVNLGTADTTDLIGLRLWLDADRDEHWSAADSLVDTLAYTDSLWVAELDGLVVDSAFSSLLVTADLSPTATPEVSVRFAVPAFGCQFASGNDGPLDGRLESAYSLGLASASLAVAQLPLRGTYTVGQSIAVGAKLTNLLARPLDSCVVRLLEITNPDAVRLDSIVTLRSTLSPGASGEVFSYFTALQTGRVSWRYRAVVPEIADSSAVVETPQVAIQSVPSPAIVNLLNSIPASVVRGQSNVFPLTLAVSHADTASTVASLVLDRLVISAERDDGQPLDMAEVAGGLILSSERRNLALLEDAPHESSVMLRFAEPSLVRAGETKRYTLLLDIREDATAEAFRLSLGEASSIPLREANTEHEVHLASSVVFPLTTGVCRVLDPAQQLAVSGESLLGELVNLGQERVPLLRLRLRHPGDQTSSQIQLTKITCVIENAEGDLLNPGDLFSAVRVQRENFTLGEITEFGSEELAVTLRLSAPLTLSTGEVEDVDLVAAVKADAAGDGFRAVIPDSLGFGVRDLSSGSVLIVVTDHLVSSSGSAFPLRSAYAQVRRPAEPAQVCPSSLLPASVISGLNGLPLVRLSLSYPVEEQYSPVTLTDLRVGVFDTLGRILDPTALFDRIGYRLNDGAVVYAALVELSQGLLAFSFPDRGVPMSPGATASVELVADLEADAPYDHFLLHIFDAEDVGIRDATDPSRSMDAVLTGDCPASWPFATAATTIVLPAGHPALSVAALPTQVVAVSQRAALLFRGTLTYQASEPQGALELRGLSGRVVERTVAGYAPTAVTQVFDSLWLAIDGQAVAAAVASTADTVRFAVSPAHLLPDGATMDVSILADVSPTARPGSYGFRLDDSSAVELADQQLGAVKFISPGGGTFPLTGHLISVVQGDLAHSFTNYPNPFNPTADGFTTIGFVLEEDAAVDLIVYSITGSLVRRLANNVHRAAGAYDGDRWDGRNDDAQVVVPGTYYCQISVRFGSGEVTRYRRKIAVLR